MIRSVYGLRTHKEMAGGALEPTCTAILTSTTTGVLRAPWLSFRLGLVFFCMISSELGVRYFLLLVCRQCIRKCALCWHKVEAHRCPRAQQHPNNGVLLAILDLVFMHDLVLLRAEIVDAPDAAPHLHVPKHATLDFAVSINHYRI
jgi:hypothetical protein